ncbi:WD-40 repeat protein [Reticulomyxa filosa]|uniref:WD-40 repeat protein n=1 Tax=Reticulomyxa filosa TaxID=46433 RepID=X6NSP9_RETFI|nr:WD-40 repeat protein [Reticulomyxa filosa]|eukprot:ETO28784.1 WD-40 repeat protein [Reticulomyxa filosa]
MSASLDGIIQSGSIAESFNSCFDKNWILEMNSQDNIDILICQICSKVANDPVEIKCKEYKDNKPLVAGERCLKQSIKDNNIICHDGCNYIESSVLSYIVNELKIVCPLQYDAKLKRKEQNTDEKIVCNFKGIIRNLNHHLNECPLKKCDCWFRSFGCRYSCQRKDLKMHLIEHLEAHFNLVAIKFNEMKDTILKLKDEADILKKKNEEYKKNIEVLKKEIENGNAISKQKVENICNDIQELKNNEEKKDNTASTFAFDLLKSYEAIKTLNVHSGYVWSIDYSTFGDEQFICSGSHDQTVSIYNINNEKFKFFKSHESVVSCVKFSQYYQNYERHVVCSSSRDKTIRFWDFSSDKEICVVKEHTKSVTNFSFSPFNNGQYLFSGSSDCTIRLWDIKMRKAKHIYRGYDSILCVAISPLQSNANKNNNVGMIGGNGYAICSGYQNGTICTWDIETVKQSTIFKGHIESVFSIKYGSNELENIGCANTLLSGSEDKSIRLWDIRSGQEIQKFNGHTNK